MLRAHTETRYVIRCDECDNQTQTVHTGHGTPEGAIRYAERYGWLITGSMDLCRECRRIVEVLAP